MFCNNLTLWARTRGFCINGDLIPFKTAVLCFSWIWWRLANMETSRLLLTKSRFSWMLKIIIILMNDEGIPSSFHLLFFYLLATLFYHARILINWPMTRQALEVTFYLQLLPPRSVWFRFLFWQGPTSQSIADVLLTAEHNKRLFFPWFKHHMTNGLCSLGPPKRYGIWMRGILINWLIILCTGGREEINCYANTESNSGVIERDWKVFIQERKSSFFP